MSQEELNMLNMLRACPKTGVPEQAQGILPADYLDRRVERVRREIRDGQGDDHAG